MLIFLYDPVSKIVLSLHISHAEDKEDRYWYRYPVTSVWGTLIRGDDEPRRRGGSILSNFVFIQKDCSLFWVGVLTQSVNLVPGISHTAWYTNSGNKTGEPACVLGRSSYPVWSKTVSALLGVHNGTLAYLNQILAKVFWAWPRDLWQTFSVWLIPGKRLTDWVSTPTQNNERSFWMNRSNSVSIFLVFGVFPVHSWPP